MYDTLYQAFHSVRDAKNFEMLKERVERVCLLNSVILEDSFKQPQSTHMEYVFVGTTAICMKSVKLQIVYTWEDHAFILVSFQNMP